MAHGDPASLRVSHEAWLELAVVAALTVIGLQPAFCRPGAGTLHMGGRATSLARATGPAVLHGELRNPFVMGYMFMPLLLSGPIQLVAVAGWGTAVFGLRACRFTALVGTATVPVPHTSLQGTCGDGGVATGLVLPSWPPTDYHIHLQPAWGPTTSGSPTAHLVTRVGH